VERAPARCLAHVVAATAASSTRRLAPSLSTPRVTAVLVLITPRQP
jgi:hypothetical protein